MDKDMWTNLGSALEDFGRAEAVARGGRTNDGSFYQGLIEQRRKKAKDEAESTRQKAIDDYLNKKRGRELAEFDEMDNPESQLSQQVRSVAQQYAPELDTEGMSASRMTQILPYLKDKYNTDKTNEARVAAQQAAIAREQKTDEYRRTSQDLQRQAIESRVSDREDRKARERQEKLDKKVENYAKTLEKTNIPGMVQAIDEVDKLLPKEGDIPGYGEVEGLIPDIILSKTKPEAVALRGAVSTLFNIELKDRSGAAVTDQELERLKKEFGEGSWKTEKQLRDGIARYKARLKEVARNIQAGTNPEVIEKYKEQGGRDYDKFIKGESSTFPRKVRKDGKEATVSNEAELKEAQAEGWR